jgi:Gas vesicle synthesis protein GvpL/GvpF
MPESLLWAYGVVPAAQAPPVGLTGLEDRPVEPVESAGLAVLASVVPYDRFAPDALERRLEDIGTLVETARMHDRVLEAAFADGDIVPFRLGVLYESLEAMCDMLAAEADRFGLALARVQGKAELGVKGFAGAAREAAPEERPASGAEYLARRRALRDRAEVERDELEQAAADVHAQLSRRAEAAVLNAPQDRRLSGRDAEMVLNGAYLVARDDAESFARLVEDLGASHARTGLELELTGPWPPYHFVGEQA